MDERRYKQLMIPVSLVVSLLTVGIAVAGLARADAITPLQIPGREVEPVIVTGTAVGALDRYRTDQIFLYAYTGDAWQQIPAQIDEVNEAGEHTETEDGLLDANDEIVFMARDLGQQASQTAPITGSLQISPGWYEIEVTDPTSPTQKGWAYLVHSGALTQTFSEDYIDFDSVTHRLHGETYSVGFATPDPWLDYLTLGDSGVDILDRTKMRLLCQFVVSDPRTWLCPISEDEGAPIEDNLIKDGPVRVIVRGGRVLAYSSMASWTISINVPSYLAGDVRFSTDWSAAASSATYYNAIVPQGVIVDGVPDTVASTPLSRWWQISTAHGSVIQVSDTAPIGGTPSNYYQDDATWDGSDTGDGRRYGDTGVYVDNPNLAFAYRFTIFMLAETQPNVGADYAMMLENPLTVTTQLHGDFTPEKIYLPLILR